MASSTPWFFKTSFAKYQRAPADDPLLSQVVRATTAAPTYFPPLTLEKHCLIDGGVFAANPALCAYAQARKLYPEETEILVVSLGTGSAVHNRPCSEINHWGIANWAVPISTVMVFLLKLMSFNSGRFEMCSANLPVSRQSPRCCFSNSSLLNVIFDQALSLITASF